MLFNPHLNEDIAIERDTMLAQQPDTLIGLIGTDDQLLALIDVPSLRQVIAINSNRAVHHLFELKLEALKALSVTEYLAFIGHTPMHPLQRRAILSLLWPRLSAETRTYWLWHTSVVERGILNTSYFERIRLQLKKGLQGLFSRTNKESFKLHPLFTDRQNRAGGQLTPLLQPALLERVQQRVRQNDLTIHFVDIEISAYLRQHRPPTESIFLSLSGRPDLLPGPVLVELLAAIKASYEGISVQFVARNSLRHEVESSESKRFREFAVVEYMPEQEQTGIYCVYKFMV